MKYRLFCSDFDDTLVRRDGTVSARSKQAICDYIAAGGVFTVITGRATSEILPRIHELGISEGLAAAYQGAVILDVATGKLLRSASLNNDDALNAVKLLEKGNYHIHIYTEREIISNRRDELLEIYESICRVKADVSPVPLSQLMAERKISVVKVLAMEEPQNCVRLKEELEEKLGGNMTVTCSGDCLVEIMPRGRDKGSAVRFLKEYFRIGKGETAAIGDQQNDLSMLEEADGKFCVENAVPQLKEIAAVVPSCEDDGVAYTLENLVN